MADRRCRGGPLHGWPVPHGKVRNGDVWIDGDGRCHGTPGKGRTLYRVDGDALVFVGHGATRCEGCGATLDPAPDGERLPACPLCGRPTA